MPKGKNIKGEDTSGAKGKGNVVPLIKGQGLAGPNKLTIKQERFCQEVASGKTLTESYRIAYEASNMQTDTIQSLASRLMADDRIRMRVNELVMAKRARESHDAARIRAHVIERLQIESIDPESSASARIRALELLGRLGGVAAFEKPSDDTQAPADADSLAATLQDKLKGLLSA